MDLLLRVLCIHSDDQFFVLVVLLGFSVQTVGLVSSLLTTFSLRVELFLFAVGFEVHSQIIELLGPSETLRVLLFLLKELIRSILGVSKGFLLL